MNILLYIFFLLISIVGNPFYQMISFLICKTPTKGTNMFQVDLFPFIGILFIIFWVRLAIYAIICIPKDYSFSVKGKNSFLYIFCERHLFQVIGLLSLWVWTSPLEGNIIGFIVMPLTLLLGSIVSIITLIRLMKTKKIFTVKNKQSVNDLLHIVE